MTEGDTWEELIHNIYEAVEGCLSIDVETVNLSQNDRVLEVNV